MAMTQRTLYKMIESVGSREYRSDEEMLIAILEQIISNDRMNIVGGRIWQLVPDEGTYLLMYEHGNIEPVGIGFRIKLKDYTVFEEVALNRTVLADETHKALRKKGIKRYSATGIGHTVRVGRLGYYEYIMAFNTLQADLEMKYAMSIAGQAVTQLLEKRRTVAEKRILETEMEHARDIQRRILPEHEIKFGPYDLYGISLPERIVGGDFFNYYRTPSDDDRMAVAIGDAASKGLPAAVQALLVSGALMMSVEFESKISSMLRRINVINKRIFSDDRFLTLFYCELFSSMQGQVLYANAGHSRPIHYHAATGQCSELGVTGPVIGLITDAKYTISTCTIQKHDVLLLYTDGITEANDGKEEYGDQRLMELIVAHARETPKLIAERILQTVQVFSADGMYSDDKTVVVIKRTR